VKLAVLAVLAGCAGHAPPPPAKYADVTTPKVEDATVAGYVTLVDFWGESCAACKVVEGKIGEQIATHDHVIVRKVDVGDGFTPIARAYNVTVLPHWHVYDTKRRLRFILIGPECLRAPTLAAELLAEK
jgi:hypothetical protein